MLAKPSAPQERSAAARARLLAAADELFYAEGIHAVGIDRVIQHAGVAKATLYNTFGSKEELVRAYLRARHAATREHMSRELERRYRTPRERLTGVFEVQGLSFTAPGFRGSAFVTAGINTPPGGAVEEVSSDYRAWLHSLFHDLAEQAGANDPKGLARQLVLLYDGAGISAWLDHDPSAEATARTVAQVLVDIAIPETIAVSS
ncbi:DNA-binding transcriptional regulator, AcrR family [Nonomuraea solani]|uniref:DNA-binding transcriptional regulator, AcrR family n=1 Tax=Nonomuraea solani TaxID=1144553 RepID=A0A1H5Y8N1_9ACTN|nr:TetR/AcrR family transcriptional regulator [Nonomuraea solani]SEG20361.1 DNA-binding transcriptional regulator, AcrR family [Nonomuraea solani]